MGPRSAIQASTSSSWAVMLSLIHFLASSRPSVMISSVMWGAPAWYSSQAASVPPASTIITATSPSGSRRPATISSKVEASPSW